MKEEIAILLQDICIYDEKNWFYNEDFVLKIAY
jgi:hypothetical protein